MFALAKVPAEKRTPNENTCCGAAMRRRTISDPNENDENEIGGLDFHFMKRNVSSQAKRSFPKKPEFKTPELSTGAHDRSM